MSLEQTGCNNVDWIHLALNRTKIGSCEYSNKPSESMKRPAERLSAHQDELCSMHVVTLSYYTPWWRLRGEDVSLLLVSDLGTRREWVVSVTPRPRFTPGEMTPGTQWRGDWVGPRAGWKQRLEEEFFPPAGDRTPVVQSVVRNYTY
jgi:hypothetical protein